MLNSCVLGQLRVTNIRYFCNSPLEALMNTLATPIQIRKFVGNLFQPNRRPHNWKLYSSRLQTEGYSGRHWPDRQHTIS